MTVQKDEQVSKRVEFKAADDERQIATGVVMVPLKVDRQGDFERPETIRDFAEDYMARLPQGEAAQGVMHAVWPDEHITLVENTVLDAPREIGGEDVPAGSWIQSFKFEDSELWTLVRDDILSGYSIGAESVEWSAPMDQDDLPDDVDVAADYPDDEPVWELQGGTVVENSAVDIPAVPDAQILATKDAGEKRIADLIGDKEQFVAEMAERGHSDGEAERLWTYLRRAVDETDVDVENGRGDGLLARMKAMISKSDGDSTASAGAAKEGRTLSQANQHAMFASIDAQLDVLDDAGVDHGLTRFSDREDFDFDVADFSGSTAAAEARGKDAQTDKDAPDGETSDADKTHMSDNDDSLEEKVDALEKRIDELDEQTDKNDDGGADDDTKAVEEKLDNLEEKLDDLAKASGQSQQLDAGDNEEGKSASKADLLGLGGDA
ncbi:XkdF-like putative serine protease domain-containing protein [Halostella sp. PRR32]|uniref:XkdF-like putative serine protease domain-containing protein n=1 Tax=Halostella sp. PRR32 TaxID=3098147 RepID=UPI002B1D2F6C|nr:XkdF-like putative serine protease domain-containing protein [Halostella sp. PRR32]